MTDLTPDHLEVLTSTPTDMEASVIVAALEDAGIHAVSTGGYTAGFKAEAPGWVQVLVAAEDLPSARQSLELFRSGANDIDWSQVDVGSKDEEE